MSRLRLKKTDLQEAKEVEETKSDQQVSESSHSDENSSDESESEESVTVPIHQKDQIIWAKIRGYAWWPAKIKEICEGITAGHGGGKNRIEIKYQITFFGDKSKAEVPQRDTRQFENAFLELCFRPKKTLCTSIKKACYLYDKKYPGLKARLLERLSQVKQIEAPSRKKRKSRGRFTQVKY